MSGSDISGILSEDRELSIPDMVTVLKADDPESRKLLFETAYRVKVQHVGRRVYLRGLVELGNICINDCLYCGIRRSNRQVCRYILSEETAMESVRQAMAQNYGSIVIQAGERRDPDFIDLVERILLNVSSMGDKKPGVTLSLGEQSEETYLRWKRAGGDRYLLRIESSNPDLFARIHPIEQKFEDRLRCLRILRKIGYQVGTGVMIGMPWQTDEDLAGDINFFRETDMDMIGMGPYITSAGTPMAGETSDTPEEIAKRLDRSLAMIALCRIVMKDVNIAVTTALQTLSPDLLKAGLMAGGNVIMPNMTPAEYKKEYNLYDGKRAVADSPEELTRYLKAETAEIGEEIIFGEPGNPLHYRKRIGEGDKR